MSRTKIGYTDADIAKAIQGSAAIMSTIANRLKCDWHTAKKYANSKPEFIQMLEAEEEKILDMADAALYAQIKNQEAWAIKWLQATKGKKRGYVEKTELGVTDKNGNDVPLITSIKVVHANLKDLDDNNGNPGGDISNPGTGKGKAGVQRNPI